MTEDRSYGVIPVRLTDINHNEYRYLLIKQSRTHWSFPKGHAENDEYPIETARRELAEETGITDVIIKNRPRFSITYYFPRYGQTCKKTVDHFIGIVDSDRVIPQEEEVLDYRWVTHAEAHTLLYRNTARQILDKAHRFLIKKPHRKK